MYDVFVGVWRVCVAWTWVCGECWSTSSGNLPHLICFLLTKLYTSSSLLPLHPPSNVKPWHFLATWPDSLVSVLCFAVVLGFWGASRQFFDASYKVWWDHL